MLRASQDGINTGFPYTFGPGHRRHDRRGPSYAANMASGWKTFQRLAESLVFGEAPKLIRQLQQSPTVRRSIRIGLDVLASTATESPAEITAGRPLFL